MIITSLIEMHGTYKIASDNSTSILALKCQLCLVFQLVVTSTGFPRASSHYRCQIAITRQLSLAQT
jgi:hypothetical protein